MDFVLKFVGVRERRRNAIREGEGRGILTATW